MMYSKKDLFKLVRTISTIPFIKDSLNLIDSILNIVDAQKPVDPLNASLKRYIFDYRHEKHVLINDDIVLQLALQLENIENSLMNTENFKFHASFTTKVSDYLKQYIAGAHIEKISINLCHLFGESKMEIISKVIAKVLVSHIDINNNNKSIVTATFVEQLGVALGSLCYNMLFIEENVEDKSNSSRQIDFDAGDNNDENKNNLKINDKKIKKKKFLKETPEDFLGNLEIVQSFESFYLNIMKTKPANDYNLIKYNDKVFELVKRFFRINTRITNLTARYLFYNYISNGLKTLRKFTFRHRDNMGIFIDKRHVIENLLISLGRIVEPTNNIYDLVNDAITLLEHKINLINQTIGHEFFEMLYHNNVLRLFNPKQDERNIKKLETLKIEIIGADLCYIDLHKLPIITKNSIEKLRTEAGLDIYKIQAVVNDVRCTNKHIKGNFIENSKEIYNRIYNRGRFKINIPHFYDLLKFVEMIKNATHFSKTPMENSAIIAFLSELYKFDFAINVNDNPITEDFKKNMVIYLTDFEKLIKPNIREIISKMPNFDAKLFRKYSVSIKSLEEYFYSKKLFLLSLFKHITIMSVFDYFHYDWIADDRGRLYYNASHLNFHKEQFVRNFISFDSETKVQSKNIVELKSLLWNQISISNYEEITLNNLKITDILLNKKIKLGKKFQLWVNIRDYIGFSKNPLTYKFWGCFNKDASCSGIQCNALVLRDINLGRYSGMYDISKDIYEVHAKYRKDWLDYLQSTLIPRIGPELIKIVKKNLNKKIQLCIIPIVGKSYVKYKPFKMVKKEKRNAFYDARFKEIQENDLMENFLFVTQIYVNTFSDGIYDHRKHFSVYYEFLENLIAISEGLTKIPLFYNFLIHRASTKQNVMTTAYGSTTYGKKDQMKTALNKYCYQLGIIPSKKLIQLVLLVSPILIARMNTWFSINLKPFVSIYEAVKKNCDNNGRLWKDPFLVDLGYFIYQIKPLKCSLRQVRGKFRANGKYAYIGFKMINSVLTVDFKKMINIFAANYIQSIDALIMFYFHQEIFKLVKLQDDDHSDIYTIHDSFSIYPTQAHYLDAALKIAYKTVYEKDLLNTQFKIQFPALYKSMNKDVIQTIMYSESIHWKNIVKH